MILCESIYQLEDNKKRWHTVMRAAFSINSPYAVCISTARFISLVKTFLSKSDINVAVQKPIPSALRKVSY